MFNFGGNFSFAEKDNPSTRLRSPKQRANAFVELLPFKNNRINLSYEFVSKRDDAYFDMSSFTTKNVTLDAFHLVNLNINQKINQHLDTYVTVSYTHLDVYKRQETNFLTLRNNYLKKQKKPEKTLTLLILTFM